MRRKGAREANRTQRPPMFPAGVEVRLFELKGSLAAGGTAEAYLRRKETGVLITDTAVIFTVEDDIGDRRGIGRDDTYGYAGDGAYGKAMRLPGDSTWYVFDLQCPPEASS